METISLLGHVLRGPINGPAYSSLMFAVSSQQMSGRVGRPQSNLFSLIKRDLKDRNLLLDNINDLNYLRIFALNRANWRSLQTL